ncbi:PRC-barrel domain-containing protein [Ferrovibrio sp.]|uniref:PRC-barrel domain-containing protein n=1 Tax=Ferrovibrio sp. TaxID=1917215 RepID=UPI00311F1FA2
MTRAYLIASALSLALAAPGLAAAQDKAPPAAVPGGIGMPDRMPDSGPAVAGPVLPSGQLIGADVVNTANERIGSVDQVLVTKRGDIRSVVVSVGGFLGVGDRKVVMPWQDLDFSHSGRQVVAVAMATREQLKAMPEYRPPEERQRERVAPPVESPAE